MNEFKLKIFFLVACLVSGEVLAVAPSPKKRPEIEPLVAIEKAQMHLNAGKGVGERYFAWMLLVDHSEELNETAWVLGWVSNGKTKGILSNIVIAVTMDGEIRLPRNPENPFGIGILNVEPRPRLDLKMALKIGAKFANTSDFGNDHFVYRVCLGKAANSDAMVWIVDWWPEIHANKIKWYKVVVDMNERASLANERVRTLMVNELDLPPRKKVEMPSSFK